MNNEKKFIGIGITTYNRPEHLKLCLSQINKHTKGFKLYIADDSNERLGIAKRKNECIKELQDCEHIVLFDDDCFPIKDGWVDLIVESHTKEPHLLYLKETSSIKKIKSKSKIDYYNNCGGCMITLTKEVANKVGGFNEEYGIYGFEHAAFSAKVYRSKLTTEPYCSPSSISEYIYSLDFDNYIDWGINHKTSLSYEEAMESIKRNYTVYKKEVINNDVNV